MLAYPEMRACRDPQSFATGVIAAGGTPGLGKVRAPHLLFLFVIGGLYGGLFTPTEAGSMGAGGALLIGIAGRLRKSWSRCFRRRAGRQRCSPC